MRVLLIALLLATLPATAARPAFVQGEAKLDQKIRLGSIQIRTFKVINDNRCSAFRHCDWTGIVIVRSEVTSGSWRRTFDLQTGKPQRVAGGTLTLIDVNERQLIPTPYRFTFRFYPS